MPWKDGEIVNGQVQKIEDWIKDPLTLFVAIIQSMPRELAVESLVASYAKEYRERLKEQKEEEYNG